MVEIGCGTGRNFELLQHAVGPDGAIIDVSEAMLARARKRAARHGWANVERLVPLLDLISRPLDYSRIVGERRLWESIRRHAGNVRVEELYFGFVDLAVGEKSAAGARP